MWLTALKLVCDRVLTDTAGRSAAKGRGPSPSSIRSAHFFLSQTHPSLISENRFISEMQESHKDSLAGDFLAAPLCIKEHTKKKLEAY